MNHPTDQNLGLVLGAEWDPDCFPVPWAPWPPHHGDGDGDGDRDSDGDAAG
jgi:hypothetical protein